MWSGLTSVGNNRRTAVQRLDKSTVEGRGFWCMFCFAAAVLEGVGLVWYEEGRIPDLFKILNYKRLCPCVCLCVCVCHVP